MLNRSGITKQSYMSTKQILANVDNQGSVGCIVDESLATQSGTKKIAKAGTPINVDLMNMSSPAKAVEAGSPMNAVLLHDVDLSNGNANGTALYFGAVNVNRVDSDVATLITNALEVEGASPLLVFMKR